MMELSSRLPAPSGMSRKRCSSSARPLIAYGDAGVEAGDRVVDALWAEQVAEVLVEA